MSNQIPNFTDKDAFAEYLGVTPEELESRVVRFADASFIAGTTGISGQELEAARQRVGIFDWTGGTSAANELLDTFGFNKGSNADFYTNADFKARDPGAIALSEKWQQAPLVQAKIDAAYEEALKTDPNAIKTNIVSNDTAANSSFLANFAATQPAGFTTNALVKPELSEVTLAREGAMDALLENNPYYSAFGQPASETLLNIN